jgi:glycosyltransferase involved in cell wall biosynthesis
MLAPPWIPIPAARLRRHRARRRAALPRPERARSPSALFAAPGSEHAEADVRQVLERPHPDEISIAIFETDHVASTFDAIDAAARAGAPFDLVHDHSGYAAFAFANRLETPLVHTLHQPFTDETFVFYDRHGAKAWAIAISRTQADQAPPGLRVIDVVANPIVVEDFPFVEQKDDFLLWVGRFTDQKGPQRAIAAAREAGVPIVLGGVVHPASRSSSAARSSRRSTARRSCSRARSAGSASSSCSRRRAPF